VTFDGQGQPLVTRLVSLPAGYEQFPGIEPTLVGTNSLYFGTTGPNSTPGAILRYDLDTGTWTNLFSFSTNGANALAYGTCPGYSAFVEWLGELYFLTRQGGISNFGVVAKFNLASNTVTKLADFEGTAGAALGRATGIFDNSGLLVKENGRSYIYYTVTSGGLNNRGTIIRVSLPAPPIQLALALAAPGELALTWTGGYAPFTVRSRESLTSGNWDDLIENVPDRAATVSTTNSHAFLRVIGTP
jgi:uncharacterized repeat protein (TIGR03803 family)